MKKLLRTFVSLFFISIFLGCAQDSGKVIGASISTSNDGVEITIKNSGYNWEIYRYDSASEVEDAFISGNKLRNGILKDKYVVPGHSYTYYVSFYDSNWNEINRQEFSDIRPTKGKGRLEFVNKPAATYKDGNLNFTTKPTVNVESPLTSNNISYQFYYRNFPDGGYYGRVGGGFNVFLNSDGSKRQNIFINEGYEVEGKDMVLISLSGINVNYDGIRYIQYYSHKELPDMPNPVKFHDNRPKVTLKDHANGIEIEIPEVNIEGVTGVSIDRKNVETGKWDMYMYIDADGKSKTSVIDYFVEPNKSYEYSLRYRDNNEYDIISTEFKKFTASHGIGSLEFSQQPVAKYESNGEMVFTTNPDVSSEIKKIADPNSIQYGFYYRYLPNGGYTGRVGGGFNVFISNNGNKTQNDFVNEGYNIDGKKMVLIDLSYISLWKNNVFYEKYFSHEELPGMPNPVNFVKYNKQ